MENRKTDRTTGEMKVIKIENKKNSQKSVLVTESEGSGWETGKQDGFTERDESQ